MGGSAKSSADRRVKITPEILEKMLVMTAQGISTRDIAATFGVSQKAVRDRFRQSSDPRARVLAPPVPRGPGGQILPGHSGNPSGKQRKAMMIGEMFEQDAEKHYKMFTSNMYRLQERISQGGELTPGERDLYKLASDMHKHAHKMADNRVVKAIENLPTAADAMQAAALLDELDKE
jgi:hypothetical protein